jgi:hypothetical protein
VHTPIITAIPLHLFISGHQGRHYSTRNATRQRGLLTGSHHWSLSHVLRGPMSSGGHTYSGVSLVLQPHSQMQVALPNRECPPGGAATQHAHFVQRKTEAGPKVDWDCGLHDLANGS